jgi:hypothetical protein
MMTSFPLIISFYTQNTPYEIEVQNLIDSCRRFDLPHHIEGVESLGSWEMNCAFKPYFILKQLQERKRPVLWVDADGVFVQRPAAQEVFSADFAVRIHPDLPVDHPSKVVSSTVYVNDTEEGRRLVLLWAEECRKQLADPERSQVFWDQIALRNALFSSPHGAVFHPMPLAYAKIFDHPGDLETVLEPVIEHYQASRRFKRIIDNVENCPFL